MKLKINGKYFVHFDAISIQKKYDSVASVFSFSCMFNPDNEEHKELLNPSKYYTVMIYNDNDDLLITGTILNASFVSNSGKNNVVISGYSISGIIEDCNIPIIAYPLESINRSLKDIASRLLNVFKLGLVVQNTEIIKRNRQITTTVSKEIPPIKSFDSSIEGFSNPMGRKIFADSKVVKNVSYTINEVDIPYKKSTASPTDTIKGYLSKLCSQRNILLTHNEFGDIVLYKPQLGDVKYSFDKHNCIEMNLSFRGQQMHSDISVIRQPSKESAGVSTVDTEKNDFVRLFRPKTKVLTNGTDTDVSKAADNEKAAELKGISVSIKTNKIINLNTGDIVEVINNEIYLYNKIKLMVSSVSYSHSYESDLMSIELVIPETYTAGKEKNFFD